MTGSTFFGAARFPWRSVVPQSAYSYTRSLKNNLHDNKKLQCDFKNTQKDTKLTLQPFTSTFRDVQLEVENEEKKEESQEM